MSGFEKMKVFISSSIYENSILLRKSLKIILENNRGEFEVYAYEDSGPASHDNISKYLFELDRSDVVVFLIDNLIDNKEENEQEYVRLRKEFDRAKEKQKLLYYISLKSMILL